jgi:adenylate cyclase
MENCMVRPYHLATELTQLFNLENSIDTVLSVAMFKLSQLMDSERSSIFLFDPLKQQLISFSSLDLEKREIRISKSSGVAGWVYEHRKPVIVNDTCDDSRFFGGVDDVTGFRTRNIICAPLIDYREHCCGIIQSLNKYDGDFTTEDLELLDLTARLVTVAIKNSRRYNEIRTTNHARGKVIRQFVHKLVSPRPK